MALTEKSAVLAFIFVFQGLATAIEFTCPPGHVGNLIHPTNCSRFISCTAAGIPVEMDCHKNITLCYNAEHDWCDWCQDVPRCFPMCTSSPDSPDKFIGDPRDPTVFHFCGKDGTSQKNAGTCAVDLWFGYQEQACVVPWQ